MKIEERLETLSKLNADTCFKNKQLYRMLYNPDLYVIAFERLKTNKGAMTHGIQNSNVDESSRKKINKIIKELKEESYKPSPSRRTYIPKANGKKRPLGIPCWRDKLVQEGINLILQCIYDGNHNPTFIDESYGFRPQRGCHTALKYVQKEFNGSLWIIKADVKGFFDNVDHHIMINTLKKRIEDERFLRLIWKFLRCGHIEDGVLFKPDKGTPQGGNLSPLLANIYLHEFDTFIYDMIGRRGTIMAHNKEYAKVNAEVQRNRIRLKQRDRLTDEVYARKRSNLDKSIEERDKHPSRIMTDTDKAVIKYARYADDWIIGLKCESRIAKEIFNECQTYFKNSLNLEWNRSKSKLQRSTKEDIEFLGVYLSFVKKRQQKYTMKNSKSGRKFLSRTVTENFLRFKMNPRDAFKRLKEKGYVDGEYQPISNKRLINLDVYEIAKIYQATIRGIANYYSFVHNPAALVKIHYWLYLSLGKTLAHKFKNTKAKQITRFGGRTMTFKGLGKAKPIEISAYGGYKRDTSNFKVKQVLNDNLSLPKFAAWRQASWLKLDTCCICDAVGKIEMHHVKHIRKLGKKVNGFTTFLRELNRKQIPVCKECHLKIHRGDYDGINLKQLAKDVRIKLGIKKWSSRNLTDQERQMLNKERG